MSRENTKRAPPESDDVLLERIRFFIADAADRRVEEVGPDTDLYGELGLDSLGTMAVFIDMAFEFGVPEPEADTDFPALNTARRLTQYVRNVTGASS